MNSYFVLVGRIMSEIPAFKWMKNLLPAHIKHPFMRQMEKQSKVFPLPIMMKNESKHEDCVDIMDSYEDQMCSLFEKATGNTDALSNYKVIIGGDQLTKVNLQEVRNLRTLAPTDRKKLVDLQPVICELWHLKQDFVETFYHFFLDALLEEVSNEESLFEVMDLGITVDDSGVISSTSTLGVPAGTSIPTNLTPSACPQYRF
ncbi:unnamed protein product [Mytilus edulis]|uniref:DUF6589 domain-containing protein n=1 Tax=Mytilus edulis TaxID=6550 RepID=A0A8S3TAK3_MYTED|nr:unnamed protein product [Mytilus edulis]